MLVLVLVLFLFLFLSPKKHHIWINALVYRAIGGKLILFIEMAMGDFPVATFDVRQANP